MQGTLFDLVIFDPLVAAEVAVEPVAEDSIVAAAGSLVPPRQPFSENETGAH